ncbi:MAG TPA: TadE family protein [Bryobacteraceae bacterium]
MVRRSLRGAGTLACRTGTHAAARSNNGQALVELAAVIPILFLLIALSINFAVWLGGWIQTENAARAAADYAILSGSSAGLPPTATASSLQALVSSDLTYLPGVSSSNPKVCIQENNNGTIIVLMEAPSGACATANANYGSPPADPEAKSSGGTLTYPNITVDITYTFNPIFSVLPLSNTIHRRTVMRIL